jgi:2-haloacid dehalogenase
MPNPKAIIFDAYGTLLDVYAVTQLAESFFPARSEALAQLWRLKQIEYTQLRTLADPAGAHYRPFWQITRDALKFSIARLGVALSAESEAALMDQYAKLDIHADVLPVLERLKAEGSSLAILSNGDPDMLKTMLDAADVSHLFDHVLSVDSVKKYKPAPEVYAMGTSTYGAAAKDIVFVSSNGWDVAGATWFGYTTFWVNRLKLPVEELGVQPHGIGSSMPELAAFVEKRRM